MDAVTSRSGLLSTTSRGFSRDDGVSVVPRGFRGGKFLGFRLMCYPSVKVRRFGIDSSFPRSDGVYLGREVIRIWQFGVPVRRDCRDFSTNVQGTLSIGKAHKWWEKGLQKNMKEVSGAEDLVESLLSAGDRLVLVDFFSPGCGGCKALHPKICQIAEMNPDVLFLQVNYEEHKSMCYSLNVHVLPFFRFYRGAHGRLCSFSCTVATIKKLRDALVKHISERCSLDDTKGLEEKELVALASNKNLSFAYSPKPLPALQSGHSGVITEPMTSLSKLDLPPPAATPKSFQDLNPDLLTTIGR
ncbi:hypothetical protein MLD38_020073 [Melastoma candidum]|uniref:Uncharacterized protein n=1 Tax=Melastoma candidum TaxID=119954 RepID=A0ACB9QDN5_9MYRT|nr:hypothetical protein MLD38_020073 [Melastoma candidum]